MRETYSIARTDRDDLPPAIRVGCFVLAKVKGAPIYLRALNKNVVLTVALRDDCAAWIGWVAVRVFTSGDVIPGMGSKSMLAATTADDLDKCAAAFGAKVTQGIRENSPPGGTKATQKLLGPEVF